MLVKKKKSVIASRAIRDAMLSHRFEQIGNQLFAAQLNAFKLIDQHLQIRQHGRSRHHLWCENDCFQFQLDFLGYRGG